MISIKDNLHLYLDGNGRHAFEQFPVRVRVKTTGQQVYTPMYEGVILLK